MPCPGAVLEVADSDSDSDESRNPQHLQLRRLFSEASSFPSAERKRSPERRHSMRPPPAAELRRKTKTVRASRRTAHMRENEWADSARQFHRPSSSLLRSRRPIQDPAQLPFRHPNSDLITESKLSSACRARSTNIHTYIHTSSTIVHLDWCSKIRQHPGTIIAGSHDKVL